MGFADRSYGSSWSGDRGGPFAFALTPWVKRLLAANFGLWLLMALGIVPYGWAVRTFGFSPASVLRHPWSPVTYMFVHGGFWHVLFNMVAVFFFGPPLERVWGSREFLKFYLLCGVGAALTSFLLIGLVGSPLVIGASGAVFGVMLAFAIRWPEAPLYIWGLLPIKAKWFVGILALMTFYATFSVGRGGGGGGVAHWTHLGGFLTAWIYLRYGSRIEERLATLRPARRKLSVHRPRRSAGGRRPARPDRPDRSRRRPPVAPDTLDEVDRILDKIKEHGIDSLSQDERTFLDDMSRRYRGGP